MFHSHKKRDSIGRSKKNPRRGRQPRVEPLEERRLLATYTVQTDQDVIDPDDGLLSLREAIGIANVSPGPDQIAFEFGHDGPATIRLSIGEILVAEALTITGDGADLLTIDAHNASRIFNFIAEEDDFTISGMTLRGGRALGNGGAIRSTTSGLLSINHSVITGSTVQGTTGPDSEQDGHGGGAFAAGDVALNYSTISNNSSEGDGGGVRAEGSVAAVSSTIAGNTSTGEKYSGGGISAAGSATITGSSVTGNSADLRGGGVFADGVLTITNSTVSGNSVHRAFSSNPAYPAGGGGVWGGAVTIESSTITNNVSPTDSGPYSISGIYSSNRLTIRNSIVAENLGDFELASGEDLLDIQYSLIGDNAGTNLVEVPVGMPDANGNLIGGPTGGAIDPMLGPLADNGGLTLTHALLPGSPAIDAGDPAAIAGVGDVPLYDQRGLGFDRVRGEHIDMGSVESHPAPELLGDYNLDGMVNIIDYVFYRNRFGQVVTPHTSADGNGNGVIDAADHGVWRENYGNTLPSPPVTAVAAESRGDEFTSQVEQNVAEQEGHRHTAVESKRQPTRFAIVDRAFEELLPSTIRRERKMRSEAPVTASSGPSVSGDMLLLSLPVRQETSDRPGAEWREAHRQNIEPVESDAVIAEFGWQDVRRLATSQFER